MTAPEYIQLKAFARLDGAYLSLIWAVSFCCYLMGFANPLYGLLALVLMVVTPFFVAIRLRNFRDYGLDGVISFMRAWAYAVFVFFYASLLLAIVQYIYFAYFDHGYLIQAMFNMLDTPEMQQMLSQVGMGDALSESLNEIQRMRSIDMALNVLTSNIMLGMVLGVPIAAVMKSRAQNHHNQR